MSSSIRLHRGNVKIGCGPGLGESADISRPQVNHEADVPGEARFAIDDGCHATRHHVGNVELIEGPDETRDETGVGHCGSPRKISRTLASTCSTDQSG